MDGDLAVMISSSCFAVVAAAVLASAGAGSAVAVGEAVATAVHGVSLVAL